MKENIPHEKLLHTVNDMASILLSSTVGDFNESVLKCMEMLAKSVDVDRTYIWENYYKDGELYCTQVFEWSEGADPQQGNELTVNVSFPEDWYSRLSTNASVNGIVAEFPTREREHLQAQGIISILVVPIFLQNKFWGFFGFDDCRHSRNFSSPEESILRSASLLIATALARNEMTRSLVKAREEALASTKAKSNFLSNMSHEIRTPINAITGMTAIARMSSDLTKVRSCLDKIDTASRQLLGIISDILDVGKIEAGKMELLSQPFDLMQTIQDIKNLVEVKANEKKQAFTISLSPDIPNVAVGDNVRLNQIFLNLLSNAVKFTPENGKIELDIKLLSNKDGLLTFEATVCDSGIGIAPEHMQRLFRPFEQAERSITRNFTGTGLGLTITKSIAKLMGGDVMVKSKLGEGSCFIAMFQLKAAKEKLKEAKPLPPAAPKGPADFSSKTALLAEDIAINREIVLELLQDTNITIECAETGKQAVKMFNDNPGKYDIIFMDIQMPEMDGYQATRLIRQSGEKGKTVPIIAMTANAYKEDADKAIESGMNAHLAKPIDINAVIEVLKKYLNGPAK